MYKCPYCVKICKKINGLKRHFASRHSNIKMTNHEAVCKINGMSFSTKKSLLLASLSYNPKHYPYNKMHRIKSHNIIMEQCQIIE